MPSGADLADRAAERRGCSPRARRRASRPGARATGPRRPRSRSRSASRSRARRRTSRGTERACRARTRGRFGSLLEQHVEQDALLLLERARERDLGVERLEHRGRRSRAARSSDSTSVSPTSSVMSRSVTAANGTTSMRNCLCKIRSRHRWLSRRALRADPVERRRRSVGAWTSSPVGIRRVTLPLPTRPGHVHALPAARGRRLDARRHRSRAAGRDASGGPRSSTALDGPVARIFVTHFHPTTSAPPPTSPSSPARRSPRVRLDYEQCELVWGGDDWAGA